MRTAVAGGTEGLCTLPHAVPLWLRWRWWLHRRYDGFSRRCRCPPLGEVGTRSSTLLFCGWLDGVRKTWQYFVVTLYSLYSLCK